MTVIQTRPNEMGFCFLLFSLTSLTAQELTHEYVQTYAYEKQDLAFKDKSLLTHSEGIVHG